MMINSISIYIHFIFLSSSIPMAVYQQIQSGEVLFPHQSKASAHYAITDGDKKRYALRVVANEDHFTNQNGKDSWKQCKIKINDQEMNTVPYQNTDNQMVFVTESAKGTVTNEISVHCNDKKAAISSVGVYDDALHYGLNIPKVTIQPHSETNILFTAMTEKDKEQMTNGRNGRKLLRNEYEDEYNRFMHSMTANLDQAMSMFSSLLAPHKEALKLPLKLIFHDEQDRKQILSKVKPLDYHGPWPEEATFYGSVIRLANNNDYVLKLQNYGPMPIEIQLESMYINGDMSPEKKTADSVLAEFDLAQSASINCEEIGEKQSKNGGNFGAIIAFIFTFVLTIFLLNKVRKFRAKRKQRAEAEKNEYVFTERKNNEETYRLMDDIDVVTCE